MLEMRQFCECCGRTLAADTIEAMICSFECTYCAECATLRLRGRCPNCAGLLVVRPSRTSAALIENPASDVRIVKSEGCPGAFATRA